MLLLRAVAFTVLLPGTVVVLVPMLLFDQGGRFDIGYLRLGGLLPILAGGPTLLWCIWDFAHRGRGTLAPIDPPQFIVRSGPYRWVRNPMYVANLLILIGEGVLFESLPILAWAGAMALAFHLFVVLYEEPSLANRFGAAYKEYRRTVPRWRPRRPGPPAPGGTSAVDPPEHSTLRKIGSPDRGAVGRGANVANEPFGAGSSHPRARVRCAEVERGSAVRYRGLSVLRIAMLGSGCHLGAHENVVRFASSDQPAPGCR